MGVKKDGGWKAAINGRPFAGIIGNDPGWKLIGIGGGWRLNLN